MLPRDIPIGLWQKIVADYFHHSGKDYLLIANLFSKNPFLFCITSKSAQVLVQKHQEAMSQYGTPNVLYTDSSPSSQQKSLKDSSRGIALTTSSHPHIFTDQMVS